MLLVTRRVVLCWVHCASHPEQQERVSLLPLKLLLHQIQCVLVIGSLTELRSEVVVATEQFDVLCPVFYLELSSRRSCSFSFSISAELVMLIPPNPSCSKNTTPPLCCHSRGIACRPHTHSLSAGHRGIAYEKHCAPPARESADTLTVELCFARPEYPLPRLHGQA